MRAQQACSTTSATSKQKRQQHHFPKKRSSPALAGWLRILVAFAGAWWLTVAHLPRGVTGATTTSHDPPDEDHEQPRRRHGDRFRPRFRPRQRHRSHNSNDDHQDGPPWWKKFAPHQNHPPPQHHQQQQQFHPPAFNAEALQALQWLFPMRRPRHLWDGMGLALRSTATGFGLGLASLVVLPLRGWRRHQWPGVGAGSLTGVLCAAVASLFGLAHGTYQLLRGLFHTPQALWEQHQGKVWHATTEDWRYYYLQQEVDELNQARHAQHHGSRRPVKDTAYYDLLHVPTDARPADIKRAYYTLARAVHPDKNRGSEQAAAQFRQLHAAYTTLYDEERRAVYDQWGSTSRSSSSSDTATTGPAIPELDVKVFFGVLFCSELVDSYIGTLSIASFTEQLLHFQRSGSSPQDLWQWFVAPNSRHSPTRRRPVDMAVTLQQRCASFVQGNVTAAEFRHQARVEAQQIAATPMGPEYLRVLGRAWIVEAQQYLGHCSSSSSSTTTLPGWGLVQSVGLALQRHAHDWRGRTRMVAEAVDLLQRLARHEKDERGYIPDEELEVMLPEILDIVWAYNGHDIAQAIRGACFRLFHDRGSGHSRFAGLLRAEAIQILGEEFLAEGSVPEDEERRQFMDYIARGEVAMQIAVMKASGQKDPVDAESMIKMHQRTSKQRTRMERRP